MVASTELSDVIYLAIALVVTEALFFILVIAPFAIMKTTVERMPNYIREYKRHMGNTTLDIPKMLIPWYGKRMFFVGRRLDKKYGRNIR